MSSSDAFVETDDRRYLNATCSFFPTELNWQSFLSQNGFETVFGRKSKKAKPKMKEPDAAVEQKTDEQAAPTGEQPETDTQPEPVTPKKGRLGWGRGPKAKKQPKAKKSKKAKSKKAKKPKKTARKYTYRITPSNYSTLSEDEKMLKLKEFIAVLASIDKDLHVSMVHRNMPITFSGRTRNYIGKEIFFTSTHDLGPVISAARIKCTRLDEPIHYAIRKEKMKHVVLNDGRLARAYTLHNMSRSITAAWINNLFAIADEVNVFFKPVKPSAARNMLLSHANTLETRIGRRHLEEAAQARETNDLIQNQQTSMFIVVANAVITADNEKDLKQKCRQFEKGASWKFLRCLALGGKQAATLAGWGHEFLFELGSCAAFHPFESSDLIEADGAGGVFVGVNEITKSPVVYDYTRRINYNFAAIGESGSGKSTMVKMYVDNFLRMVKDKYGENERVMICIIDPHGEYANIAPHFGCDVVNLTARDELGMDPFGVMEHPDQAASILCETVGMPSNLKSLVIAHSDGCSSVDELMDRLKEEEGAHTTECQQACAYFEQFVQGGISKMFHGKHRQSDRTIYSLYKAEKNQINSMLISMAMQRAWRDMRDAPARVPKLFLIDEGWFVIAMESTAEILQDIAKSGRKENVHLMFLTQEPEDILKNDYGTAMINNSATILLLRLKARPAKMLQGVLHLSDTETKSIQELDVGHGIMRADDHRINLHIMPDAQQLEVFNTRVSFGK